MIHLSLVSPHTVHLTRTSVYLAYFYFFFTSRSFVFFSSLRLNFFHINFPFMHVYVLPMLVLLFYFEWKRETRTHIFICVGSRITVHMCVCAYIRKQEIDTEEATEWERENKLYFWMYVYNTRADIQLKFLFSSYVCIVLNSRLKRKIIHKIFLRFLILSI